MIEIRFLIDVTIGSVVIVKQSLNHKIYIIYTVQCSAAQYSAVQCSAVQCSAVQCSAVQCSTVQCGAVQC